MTPGVMLGGMLVLLTLYGTATATATDVATAADVATATATDVEKSGRGVFSWRRD